MESMTEEEKCSKMDKNKDIKKSFIIKKKNEKKRKSFSIEEKKIIIDRLEAGESNGDLAKKFGVPHSTICAVSRNRSKIKELVKKNMLNNKRIRASKHVQVEEALLNWFHNQQDNGISVNGPILQRQAEYFALQMNIPNYKCTTSWINRFKCRNNLTYGKIKEDIKISDWLETTWPGIRAEYTDDQIFNADEVELYYKRLPVEIKYNGVYDPELCRERLTVLLATNMSGTIKKKILVIGKPQNKKFLKCLRSSPVDYDQQSQSLMTPDIFKKWVKIWDRELMMQKNKILLLLDDCPEHPALRDLNNINLVFVPPNTNIKQPMEKGINQRFESNMYQKLNLKLINKSNLDPDENVILLNTISIIDEAWTKLTSAFINNCFKDAGFADKKIDEYNDCSSFYVNSNDTLTLCETTEEDISESGTSMKLEGYSSNESSHFTFANHNSLVIECDEDEEEIPKKPSISDVIKAAETLNTFVQFNVRDEETKLAFYRIFNLIYEKAEASKFKNEK